MLPSSTLFTVASFPLIETKESGVTVLCPQGVGVSAELEIPLRVSHPSNIQAKYYLTLVLEWELVYPT
jgi:hypothetical protein